MHFHKQRSFYQSFIYQVCLSFANSFFSKSFDMFNLKSPFAVDLNLNKTFTQQLWNQKNLFNNCHYSKEHLSSLAQISQYIHLSWARYPAQKFRSKSSELIKLKPADSHVGQLPNQVPFLPQKIITRIVLELEAFCELRELLEWVHVSVSLNTQLVIRFDHQTTGRATAY